jgi:hypothetical protein
VVRCIFDGTKVVLLVVWSYISKFRQRDNGNRDAYILGGIDVELKKRISCICSTIKIDFTFRACIVLDMPGNSPRKVEKVLQNLIILSV